MKENRYTRLKAIEEFGYDVQWDDLNDKHVGIVGIGGLGCITAEMSARCGIGKISLFDFDTVEIVNLNRLLFREEHIGMSKVKVAAEELKKINPDVEINYYTQDIMNPSFEDTFESEIARMDILLNGLDNIPAREYLNVKCVSQKVVYIDAGASRSGLSGYIHPVIPMKTACASCLNSTDIDLPDERGEPCVASLPSTMAILASVQIQEMLKYLLDFGKMIDYLMYDMISGNFLSYQTKRDRGCPICGDQKKQKLEEQAESKISKRKLDKYIEQMEQKEDS